MAPQRLHMRLIGTPELVRTLCGMLFPISDAPLTDEWDHVTCCLCQRTRVYKAHALVIREVVYSILARTTAAAASFGALALLDGADGKYDHVIHWCRVLAESAPLLTRL